MGHSRVKSLHPWKQYRIHSGLLEERLCSPALHRKLNQAAVDRTMEASKFYEFDRRVQGPIDIKGLTYHGGGHVGIGASLGDVSIFQH